MSSSGGVHSALASALACTVAWHSTETLGGVAWPSQLPLQATSTLAAPWHRASALASQPPFGAVYSQVPSHLPLQVPPAASSQVPRQEPSQVPLQLPAASFTEQVPSQV